ncbi:MAG: HAMP domain-containing sensor histidine kinase [Polyangia bacterium]|jgi:signal transduction histidine kinase|nr:HAMP domain-containing sensor histidine kinase [Polyangia bacterium]
MIAPGAEQESSHRERPLPRPSVLASELRTRELAERLRWFVLMRWAAVLVTLGGGLVAHLRWLPAKLDPRYFVAVASMLALSNLGATLRARRPFSGAVAMRWFLFVQMLTDFAALSVISYACGTVETPVLTLFMLHIILATQFFPSRHSQLATLVAWAFACAPLLLEYAGAIPVLTIFDGHLKAQTSGDLRVTMGFVAGIGGSYGVCWYLVSRITSSLKRREHQLQEAFELLQRVDREKSLYVLRATHELKSPITAIQGYAYTLRDGYYGPLPEKALEVLDRIGDRCDRVTGKITDIIQLSRLRTLVQSPRDRVAVDLRAMLAVEAREAALQGELRRVAVAFDSSGPPVRVAGAQELLHTLFSNLLRNAVQYSREGGQVTVSLDRSRSVAVIKVTDQGIGIPKEHLEEVFEEHFRSPNALTHHPGGTGLGLPMVKEIVRIHDGQLKVESEEGQGAAFTVTLPLAGPEDN